MVRSSDDLAALVARVIRPDHDSADRGRSGAIRDRSAALAALVPVLTARARQAGLGAVAAGRWLTEELIELVPRLAFRDAATLRRQFPGQSEIQIAEQLVHTAKRTTAAIGAAAGGLSAVEFVSPPLLLAVPVQIAAETIAVAAVEIRLVAELHEIMQAPVTGSGTEKASAYLMAWVRRRAVSATGSPSGMVGALSGTARKEVRSHLMRRMARGSTTAAPFMAGAVAGAELNRRATKHLADAVLSDLRDRQGDRWFRTL